jgi:hypothetical protein
MDLTFPVWVSISVAKRNFSPAIINFYGQKFIFLVMKGIGIGRAQRGRVSYGCYISCSGLNFCSEAKIFDQNRISTMGQVTGGQSRVVKPKIEIFRLCSLRPNASKMGVGCTHIIGAGRVNNSEEI